MTFEALVARIVADYTESRDPRRENAWIAELGGERAGFRLLAKERHTSFGRELSGQTWSLELRPEEVSRPRRPPGAGRYARSMRRHPALVPLSHDHHHSLVQARRLKRAADGPEAAAAAAEFLRFFADDPVRHFREEEEQLFPLVADAGEARELVVEALLQHQRLHALAGRLRAELERDGARAGTMRELAELLEAHIRLEERRLFPLIERLVDGPALDGLPFAAEPASDAPARGGPVWGTASEDLNATLVSWPAGGGPPEHVNEERDVLLVVLDGAASVAVDGEERPLPRGEPLIVAKGATRRITAGPEGVRYVSAHLRRPPLQIRPARGGAPDDGSDRPGPGEDERSVG